MENFFGVEVSDKVKGQNPKHAKTKSSGKRIVGEYEKAIQKLMKRDKKCRKCSEIGHDSRMLIIRMLGRFLYFMILFSQ